jgi:hypothetical protein
VRVSLDRGTALLARCRFACCLAAALIFPVASTRATADAVEVAAFPLDDVFWGAGSLFGFYPHAPVLAVARDRARLYVPLGRDAQELLVFDVTDPLHPTLTRAPGLPARAIAVLGTTLYASDGGTLRITDMADPAAPVPLGEVALAASPTHTAGYSVRLRRDGERTFALVSGGGPFLGDDPALRVVDVTDPTQPRLRGGSMEDGGVDLAIEGAVACVASYARGLRCYDVGDDVPIRLLGATGTLGVATSVAMRDGIAYVLNGGVSNAKRRASLVSVDVRDPTQPTLLGVASFPAELLGADNSAPPPPRGLQLDGDLLYAGAEGGVLVFEVADPHAPRFLERLETGALTMGVKVRGGRLLAMAVDGLHVLEASPEASLPPVCGEADSTTSCLALGETARLSLPLFASYEPIFPFHDGPHPAALADGVLYVPLGESGLVTADVAGASPRLLVHFPDVVLRDVALDGATLYGVDRMTLRALDVADPAKPRLIGSLGSWADDPGYVGDAIAVRDGRAYTTGGGPWSGSVASAIRIFDVGDPADMRLLGDLPGYPGADLALDGDRAYVASFTGGLKIYDVAQPGAIALLGESGTGGSAMRVVVAPPFAYVLNAGDDLSLAAFDVSDPTAPVLADLIALPRPLRANPAASISPGWRLDMALAGESLVIGTPGGALVADVAEPHAVRIDGALGPDLFARALGVAGDRVAIASDAGVSLVALTSTGMCDADADSFVDWFDVGAVADALGDAASPTDPLDPDRDGTVTVADAERCIQECENETCAPVRGEPPCRARGELGRLDVAWFGLLTNPGAVDGIWPRQPLVLGGALYEATGAFRDDIGIQSFDVTSPTAPRPLASLATVHGHALAAAGDLLVSVDGYGLDVVDVSHPETPRAVGHLDLADINGRTAVGVAGAPGRAYVTGENGSYGLSPALRVVDLSDPAQPVVIGETQETIGYDVAVSGSHAFVARGELSIFDLANEAQPGLVASLRLDGGLSLNGDARQVEVAGNLALVLLQSFRATLVVVDVSDPQAPVERSRILIPSELYRQGPFRDGLLTRLSVAETRAFVGSGRGAIAFDFSDPDAVAALGNIGDDAFTGGVAAAGDHLLVVNRLGVQAFAADPLPFGPPGCPKPPRCGLFGIEPMLLLAGLAARRRRSVVFAATAAVALWSATARADATAYDSRAAFEAAIESAAIRRVDFDSIAAGSIVASGWTLEGVSFEAPGRELVVTDAWQTTSGAHSLGATGLDALLAGDALVLDADAAHAIGLTLIGAGALPGDFELRFAGAVARNGSLPEAILADGEAWFVGIVADAPVSPAEAEVVALLPTGGDSYVWNVDDVTLAPEPAAPLAAGGALGALLLLQRSLRSWRITSTSSSALRRKARSSACRHQMRPSSPTSTSTRRAFQISPSAP